MTGFKLLLEMNDDIQLITENVEGSSKSYFIEGTFLQGNIRNRNGRIYPTDTLAKEVQNYTESHILKRRAFGELNHPANPSINLDRVSHLITEIKQDGDNFIGRAKILGTPMGKIVQSIMEEGGCLGVSSRGLGSLKESREGKIVQSDFMLTTAADIVSDPSAPQAFVENIMENADWIFDGANWVKQEQVYNVIKEYKEQKRAIREETFLKLWQNLLK